MLRRLLLVVVVSLGLVGCGMKQEAIGENPSKTDMIDRVMSGILVSQGEVVLLKNDQGSTMLESYSVDFSQYDGQKVSVTGQYSGDTLFVDEISLASE